MPVVIPVFGPYHYSVTGSFTVGRVVAMEAQIILLVISFLTTGAGQVLLAK